MKMIKDYALPYFVKAVSNVSMKDPNPYLTASLRKQMNDADILPEFTVFVKILDKHLSLHISWRY